MTTGLRPRSAEPTQQRFRGWWILVVSIVSMGLTGPGQTIGVSVFVDHIIEDLELSRSAVTQAYLFGTLGGSLALPRVGRRLDQFGVRKGQIVIGALFAVALINMSLVNSWLWLTFGFVFIRMLGQGSLSMVTTVAVAHWFDRRRGFAMGLLAVGGGSLMALVPVLMNAGIDQWGWRQTWLVAALIIVCTVIPLGMFGLVDRPELVGQIPDGTPPDDTTMPEPVWGLTRREAIRVPMFWILTAATMTASMLATALIFHQVDLLETAGLNAGEAARMFLPQVLGGVFAGLATGVLMDRFGGRYLPSIAMGLLVSALLLATQLGSTSQIVAYAITLGVTGGTARTATTTLIPGWFGTKHVGSLNGMVSLASVAGSAAGPFLLTLTQEAFDSYTTAVTVLAAIPITVGVAATVVRPPETPLTVAHAS